MPEIRRDINVDVGIELIVDAENAQPLALPETRGFTPADTQVTARLAEILSPPTVEQTILESLQPVCHNSNLMTPTGFQAAHERCRFELQTKLDKLQGTADGNKIERLIKLLDEKQDLSELLVTLRKLLQQV